MHRIPIIDISAENFAPFGDVFDSEGAPDKIINQGLCGRYHNRAQLDIPPQDIGISLFNAQPRSLPYTLEMVERHPLASQAFIPMHDKPFLVIVAEDQDGTPKAPKAFLTKPHQAINFHRNRWHGVLTPLYAPGIFAVIDYIGNDNNLVEFWYDEAFTIVKTEETEKGSDIIRS